jgi:hypothetical protein
MIDRAQTFSRSCFGTLFFFCIVNIKFLPDVVVIVFLMRTIIKHSSLSLLF